MIYKYNVACSNRRISDEEFFIKINQKIETIRNCDSSSISTLGPNMYVTEKGTGGYNPYVFCSRIKTLYAICAIRTDENYINQWLILKRPINGYKKIYLCKTESADTNLYRRMTIDEIKTYFNDLY